MSDHSTLIRNKHLTSIGGNAGGGFGYFYFYFAGHRAGLSVPSAGVSR